MFPCISETLKCLLLNHHKAYAIGIVMLSEVIEMEQLSLTEFLDKFFPVFKSLCGVSPVWIRLNP